MCEVALRVRVDGEWRDGETQRERPGICGTQVKSSGNKNRMSPSRSSDGAYFSETPPSWHVKPIFSLIAIL